MPAPEVRELKIPGVLVITPPKFGDHRGFFSETYNKAHLAEAGISCEFVQDNQSRSAVPGTLRGLHFQHGASVQAKLVRVLRGSIFDVAIDIRKGSPTFGEWVGAEISESNWSQIYIPRGFAHGFMTLEPDTEVAYKVDSPYDPDREAGIMWNDPDLAIDWPLNGLTPVLSDKDAKNPAFAATPDYFEFD
ncbi:MAG: dTDP-4-dehydrorhamnose 3,5-epimerase [Planctomycetota bacterium]